MASNDIDGQNHPSIWVADLCHRHQDRLRKIARGFAAPGLQEEDLVQEMWVRVVELALAKPPDRPSLAWLVRVATFVAREQARRHAEAEVPSALWIEERLSATESSEPLPPWALNKMHSEVHSLPECQRKMLQLRYRDGLTQEEIAKSRNVALGTVKATLNRARSRLRSRLLPLGEMWLQDDI